MLTLSMDKKPLEQLENDLDRFCRHVLPCTVRNCLNSASYQTAEDAKENIGRQFTERNQYTRRSIRYRKTFSRDIDRMESSAGSVQPYLRSQEEGFTESKSGKHGVVIPTSASANQMGQKIRTRRIQRRNWMSSISLGSRRRNGRGSTVVAVREAVESGRRVVFIDSNADLWGRPTGLYRVVGGRKGGRGWPKGAKLQMIYDLERASVTTRPHRWLAPATDKITKKLDELYRDALIRQIRKH